MNEENKKWQQDLLPYFEGEDEEDKEEAEPEEEEEWHGEGVA